MGKSSKILAGTCAAMTLIGAAKASAQTTDCDKKIEDDNPTTITVLSQRNVPEIDGRCYAGTPFTYEVLDFYARRIDSPQTTFRPRFFYDVDNDGKWGKMEQAMEDRGIPMYMSDDFTEKFLEAYRNKDENELCHLTNLYEAKFNELKKVYDLLVKKEEQQRKTISDLEGKAKDSTPVDTSKSKSTIEEKAKDVHTDLIWGLNFSAPFNTYSTNAGIRVGNGKFGLGATLDVGFGNDKLIDSYLGPLSAGRTAYGTVTDTNRMSIGGSVELQLAPFIFGIGADYATWLRTTVEQIRDTDETVIKSNTNSVPNRQVFGKVYGGVELGSEDIKARVLAGYQANQGFYLGAGTTIRLNRPRKADK